MSAGIQIVNSDQNKESCDAIDRFLESFRVGTARYMMVYGAKWWSRKRGRTSGANFLKKPDSTDVVTQTPGKIVVPNKCL